MTQHLNHFIHRAFPSTAGGVPSGYSGAWGTRVIVPGYSGSLMRVRRSSDNTEQDIGSVAGLLDTVSLLAFAGAGDAFVRTLHDQSGNARDFAQTTQANQPGIVVAGSVLTGVGGQPALDFDGTNDYLETAGAISNIMTTTDGLVLTVFNVDAINTNTGAPYNDDGLWADDNTFVGTHLRSSGPDIQAYGWDGSARSAPQTIATATNYVHIWRHTSPSLRGYLNSSTPATASGGLSVISSLAGKMRLGRQATTAYYDGKIAEVIAYSSGLTDLQIAALGADRAAIYSITWT